MRYREAALELNAASLALAPDVIIKIIHAASFIPAPGSTAFSP
jgi:hypothetical protein